MPAGIPHHLAAERGAVLALIAESFRNVNRNGGVSWSEAVVRDNYGSDEDGQAAREADHDRSWEELVDNLGWDHEVGVGGFSFLDAIGFRYYLPAAMTRCARDGNGDLDNVLIVGPSGNKSREWKLEKLSLLDESQCRCVARFLRFIIAVRESEGDKIGAEYWREAFKSHWQAFAW